MPLTGRDAELGVLRRVARAAAAGAGGAVLVVGEAGIGKTALLDAAAADVPLQVLRGRAWEEGGAPPYWPWREVADAGGWDVRWEGADELVVFAGLVAALRRAAADVPLFLSIDDLHAADEGSVRLSRYVARAVAETPVALVLAGRPSERLDALLADADVLALGPLGPAEAGALVDALTTRGLTEPARLAVVERAAGNPLFLRELARGGADVDNLPAGVLAAVAQRLSSLPTASAAAVRAAAVLGREVDPAAVAALCDLTPSEVLDLLEPAVDAGLIAPLRSGRWRFGHDLVREAAEAGLSPRKRAELHAAAAGAPGTTGSANVARHLLAAVPAIPAESAVAAARQAAQDAEDARSLGEAVLLMRRALPLLVDRADRLAWLLRLGDLALDDGQVALSHEVFDEAVVLARSAAPQHFAAAVLGRTARLLSDAAITDFLPLLDEASQRCLRLGHAGLADVVRLCARRARLIVWSDPVAGRAAAEEAVALADDQPDDVRYDALAALHVCCWGAGGLERAAEVSAAMVETAQRTGDYERQVEAWIARLVDHFRVGDVTAADDDLAALVRVADASGRPRHRYFALSRLATKAFLAGRVADGERLSEQARRLGEEIEEPDTIQVFHGSRVCVLAHLYDRQELTEVARWFDTTILAVAPEAGWFGAGVHAALGDGDRAVSAVRGAVASMPDWVVPGRLHLMELSLAVQAAVVAGDLALAAELETALRPWAGQVAVNHGAVTVGGLVDHQLGRLAALQGRLEEAQSLLTTAAERYRAMGAALWLGEAEAQLAALGTTSPTSRTATQRAVLRRAGDGWEVGFLGATAVVPDARGLQHLAVLLARPGVEVPSVALVSPESAPVAAAEARDALLDDAAKTAYRGRIAELRAALDDADALADPEASGQAQAELDALVGELRRAVGLGGRDRVAHSAEQRARVAVRKAITASLDRLAEHDSRFAHVLRRDVHTGRTCRYEPDPDTPVIWALR